jgi:uncharacterized protein (TIGR03437 family)
LRVKYIYAALAAIPVTLLAYSTGPPIAHTGNIDGGANCSQCHRDLGTANSDPRGSVRVENVTSYVPGVPQNVRITISHPDQSRWGFQLTARFISDNSMAGTFTPVNEETKVVCADNGPVNSIGTPGPCQTNQLSWIEHANAVRTAQGAGHTYEFQWTPPAEEKGDIMLYFAGNAANGNGNFTGDHIYTNTLRVPLSSDASCSISKKPTLRSAVNAGPHAGPISGNDMVEIYGADFQAGSRSRLAGLGDLGVGPSFAFPKVLSCIAVEIDGQRAPVWYVQQDQINVQAPTTAKTGPVTVVVVANAGKPNELRSDPATITLQQFTPGFFTFDGKSIAAQFAGRSDIVANPTVVPGGSPAKPGDLVTLYGSGFGYTNPVWQAGEVTSGTASLANPITVTIGGVPLAAGDILYAGTAPQSISGLYQFNFRIPASVADGDQPVVVTVGGVSSPSTATIPIKR